MKMKILLFLILALLSGCNARLVRPKPKPQVDLVRDAFWDYVSQATRTAEDSLRQIQQSQLGKDLNNLIAQSTKAVNQFSDTLRTQVAPLSKDLVSKFSQEAERLQVRLQKDMTAAGANLQPYVQELSADLQRQVEELRNEATPYAEAMDPEALGAVLLRRSQDLKVQLDKSVKELQDKMVPFTEEMKGKLAQSVDEFQKSMVPMAQNFQVQMTKKVQENLGMYGEELLEKLDTDAQQLKKQLTGLWRSFAKMIQ